MIFIAHRGNLKGSNKITENTVDAIKYALSCGFDCEIDVWVIGDEIWLGHDSPDIKITQEFLDENSSKLWIHCKNIAALVLLKDKHNCFFHDKDEYTLTSNGTIWGNINSPIQKTGIQVMPELANIFSFECEGICTDYPLKYREMYEKHMSA